MQKLTVTANRISNSIKIQAAAPVDAPTFSRLRAAGFSWRANACAFIAPWTSAAFDTAGDMAGAVSIEPRGYTYHGARLGQYPRLDFVPSACIGSRPQCNAAALQPATMPETEAPPPAAPVSPAWFIELPAAGLEITAAESADYRIIPAALAGAAYDALTQNHLHAGGAFYAYVLPAAGNKNGSVRLLPEDQTAPAPWRLLDPAAIRPAMATRAAIVATLSRQLQRAPIIGNAHAAPVDQVQASGEENQVQASGEYTITRDYKGIHAHALPGDIIGSEAHKTFTYALSAFSYLLEMGEKITLEAWRWRIAKHCAPSDRIAAVLCAIDAARGEADHASGEENQVPASGEENQVPASGEENQVQASGEENHAQASGEQKTARMQAHAIQPPPAIALHENTNSTRLSVARIITTTPAARLGKTWWLMMVYENYSADRYTAFYWHRGGEHDRWTADVEHPRYDSNKTDSGLPQGLKKLYARHQSEIKAALIEPQQAENIAAIEDQAPTAASPADADMARLIAVAADSIAELRRLDVYRVLVESNRRQHRAAIAAYIKRERPDLADEVDDVLDEAAADKQRAALIEADRAARLKVASLPVGDVLQIGGRWWINTALGATPFITLAAAREAADLIKRGAAAKRAPGSAYTAPAWLAELEAAAYSTPTVDSLESYCSALEMELEDIGDARAENETMGETIAGLEERLAAAEANHAQDVAALEARIAELQAAAPDPQACPRLAWSSGEAKTV